MAHSPVTPIAISEITRRKRAVSAEMAIKLGRLFSVSPELWMGVRADYDLEIARERGEADIFRRVLRSSRHNWRADCGGIQD